MLLVYWQWDKTRRYSGIAWGVWNGARVGLPVYFDDESSRYVVGTELIFADATSRDVFQRAILSGINNRLCPGTLDYVEC
jgi:hypothetical protein